MAMPTSTRVWLLPAVLLACVVAVRSAAAAAAAAEEGAAAPAPSAGFGLFGCNPLTDKTCRPGDSRAPENQEEEGGFGVRLPSMPSIPGDGDGDGDGDDELPSFDTHMTILGH